MSERRNDLFPELMPPSGGLARLRTRLDNDSPHRSWRAWLAVPAAMGLVAGLWLVLPERSPVWDATLNPALVRYGATAPGEGVTVSISNQHETAVAPVSVDGDVIFYWIATTGSGDAA